MRTVDIEEARAQLQELVEAAMRGETFVIAKGGNPLVKVFAVDSSDAKPRRLGFLAGQFRVPEDFDRMHGEAIDAMFDPLTNRARGPI